MALQELFIDITILKYGFWRGKQLFSEQFEFQRIHSNFSDNIYELKRNINYKVNYNRMINAWIDERGY